MLYAQIQGNKVIVKTRGMSVSMTREEFARKFGDTPRDDAHAREILGDFCGEWQSPRRIMSARVGLCGGGIA